MFTRNHQKTKILNCRAQALLMCLVIFSFGCSRSGPRAAPQVSRSKTSSSTDAQGSKQTGTSASSIVQGGSVDGSLSSTNDDLNGFGGDGKVEITKEQFATIGAGIKTGFLKDIVRQPLDPINGNFEGVDAKISSIFLSAKFTSFNITPRTGKLEVSAGLNDIHVNLEKMHFGAQIDVPILGSQYLETDCTDTTIYLAENTPAEPKADVIPKVEDNKISADVENINISLGDTPRVAGPASCSGLPLIKDLVAFAINQAMTIVVQSSEGLISSQIKNAMAPLESQLNNLVISKPAAIPNFPTSIEMTDEKMIIHFTH